MKSFAEFLHVGTVADTTLARRAFGHGWMLTFLGCSTPLVVANAPAVGAMHLVAITEGACLLGAAGGWHLLQLDTPSQLLALRLLLGAFYANLAGCVLAAAAHASGNQFDRSFTCSMLNADVGVNRLVAILLNLSLIVLPALALLAFGALAEPATILACGRRAKQWRQCGGCSCSSRLFCDPVLGERGRPVPRGK